MITAVHTTQEHRPAQLISPRAALLNLFMACMSFYCAHREVRMTPFTIRMLTRMSCGTCLVHLEEAPPVHPPVQPIQPIQPMVQYLALAVEEVARSSSADDAGVALALAQARVVLLKG